MTDEDMTDPGLPSALMASTEFDPTSQLYCYRANITRVYDGDSVTCDIDLGLGSWLKKQKLRLYGINTPELRGSEEEKVRGRAARDWLIAALMHIEPDEVEFTDVNASVILETYKDKSGKYGRWLCTIWNDEGGTWRNLNEALIEAGHAVEYMKR